MSDEEIATFGPFKLSPSRRRLEQNGVVVALGDRALDILIALVNRAGRVVSQRDLVAQVWRDLVVTPGNLRVNMSALRKALGCGEGDVRYIENVTGQGYCFVAPVVRTRGPRTPLGSSLPPALARMVGRDDTVQAISTDLRADRFVSIVGPGGMGKTTVAVAVAHGMLDDFEGKVNFVDLSSITDPALLTAAVASTLGISAQSADPQATLISYLRDVRMLLVLDNCEHVIDAAAALAELLFNQAKQVHILATSREALRAEGECARWLVPLESPLPENIVNAAEALAFPAVKLFVDRAKASDIQFELTDLNAPIVADICRRLDGIALALEIVAGRVGTYGLEGTADLLDKRLGLHWPGRRMALPRHQNLHALLDWSYGLLPQVEQDVLAKLSIFVGTFTLQAAHSIASLSEVQLAGVLDNLISKSLISPVKGQTETTSYRLLETTRSYALERLDQSGELDATAERHARYYTELLDVGEAREVSRHAYLGNLRSALEWAFGKQGKRSPETGASLAACAAPLLLEMSLWHECRRWCEAALALIAESEQGGRRELVLQDALAISSLLTAATEARSAITRGLEIAVHLGDTKTQFRLLGALHVYLLRMIDFKGALGVAEEMGAVANSMGDATSRAIADWMLGSSNYCLGNLPAAKKFFERGFTHGDPRDIGKGEHLAGLHYRTRALYGLGRVLWLCGFPDRALRFEEQAVTEAAETGSPFNVSYSLVYPCYVFLASGELDVAEKMIEKVMSQPHWQGRLVWFHTEALALKGELLVRRGSVKEGIDLLSRAHQLMRESPQRNLMLASTACSLAEALIQAGQADQGLAVIDATLAHAPNGSYAWDAPEVLRVRGHAILSMQNADEMEAERTLMQSLALAREQSAKSWELRTAMTVAKLRARQGRVDEGRQLVSAVLGNFGDGLETVDLAAAKNLLAQLASSNPGELSHLS